MAQRKQAFGGLIRNHYLLLVDICGALFVIWAVSRLVIGDEAWVTVVQAVWLIVLTLLYPSSRRDEFVEHCWRTATSATFLMLIAAPLLVAFGEGLMHGFAAGQARDIAEQAGKVAPPDTRPDPLTALARRRHRGALRNLFRSLPMDTLSWEPDLKNRLKVLRAERDWSQAQLGDLLGVSRQAVNAIETGKYDPSLPLAFKLARLFETRIEEIFDDGVAGK
jgi:putative transcriptional regulator